MNAGIRIALVLAGSILLLITSAQQPSVGGLPISDCSTGPDNPTGTLRVLEGGSEPVGGLSIRTFSIEVEVGIGLDSSCLAHQVDRVLGDKRSWIAAGSLGWARVASGPDLRIIFASPGLTDVLCSPVNTGGIYSCRNGNRVVLNVFRWREGSPEYRDNLDIYRTYLINHEVGHFLGNGHTNCPSPGAPAPVMAQQTKSLQGCTPNGWPFPGVAVDPETWNGRFWDDDTNPFEADIEWIANLGITVGCNPPENTRFCPDDQVTRGEMAAFLDRSLNLPETNIDFFEDDDGTLFEASINRLASAGITTGCHGGRDFCPSMPIPREQFAAFLHRSSLDLVELQPFNFTDISDSQFKQDIQWLSGVRVTLGCNPPVNDRFCPRHSVTRGQMAAFLRRALDY